MRRVLMALIFPGALLADEAPVSFSREVAPILKRNCQGCHRPGKMKGELDLTTFAALLRGGKHGEVVKAAEPAQSELLEKVRGEEPEMPPDGEPLSEDEVAKIARWIAQGAANDIATAEGSLAAAAPPRYRALPAIASVAWSPDGALLAVSGTGEVVLHQVDEQRIAGRLPGTAPRVESIAFSADGKLLAAAGGAPSEFGEIQLWEVGAQKLVRTIRTSTDSVFGVSFSPDASRVAVGCADKLVRAFDAGTGLEVMKCDNHIDWVFATAFTKDGARVVSASRDKAVKLIDLSTGRLIDDINRPREPVLSLARHPREDWIAFGSETGEIRLHRAEPRGGRLAEGDDKENSFVREFERIRGPVHALAFSGDGEMLAAATAAGEWKIYKTSDGKKIVASKEPAAAIYAVAFDPRSRWLATAGTDGKVRFWDVKNGALARSFDSVPISEERLAEVPP